jgi:hypothetical protein
VVLSVSLQIDDLADSEVSSWILRFSGPAMGSPYEVSG